MILDNEIPLTDGVIEPAAGRIVQDDFTASGLQQELFFLENRIVALQKEILVLRYQLRIRRTENGYFQRRFKRPNYFLYNKRKWCK